MPVAFPVAANDERLVGQAIRQSRNQSRVPKELGPVTKPRSITSGVDTKLLMLGPVEYVNWQEEEPCPGVFRPPITQTKGPAPKTQEKGFYRGCQRYSQRTESW